MSSSIIYPNEIIDIIVKFHCLILKFIFSIYNIHKTFNQDKQSCL